MAWVVVRITEEEERKDIDVYVDWEGFASGAVAMDILNTYLKKRDYMSQERWQRILLLHHVFEALDTWLDAEDAEEMQILYHQLDALHNFFSEARKAWMDAPV